VLMVYGRLWGFRAACRRYSAVRRVGYDARAHRQVCDLGRALDPSVVWVVRVVWLLVGAEDCVSVRHARAGWAC